jgi:hypothetical protein
MMSENRPTYASQVGMVDTGGGACSRKVSMLGKIEELGIG